jgi:tetratricopeptide (TPR) repeat protein
MPQVPIPDKGLKKIPKVALPLLVLAGVLVVGLAYLTWRLVPSAASTVATVDAVNAGQGGDYKQSYDVLKSAYGRAIFSKDKALILSRLAVAADEKGDKNEELADYQALDKLTPNDLATQQAIGDLADQLGHKDVAISAYKQAIKLMTARPDKGAIQTQIDGYTARVSELSK